MELIYIDEHLLVVDLIGCSWFALKVLMFYVHVLKVYNALGMIKKGVMLFCMYSIQFNLINMIYLFDRRGSY